MSDEDADVLVRDDAAEDAGVDAGFDTGPIDLGPNVVSVTIEGEGSARSVPMGIECEPNCAFEFASGTALAVTATGSPGWYFGGWGGIAGCRGARCAFTVRSSAALEVIFDPDLRTYLPLDGDFTDVSGRMRNATSTAAPSFDTATIDRGVSFDGDQILEVAGLPGGVQSAMTICAFIEISSTGGMPTDELAIFTRGDDTGASFAISWLRASGTIQARWWRTNSGVGGDAIGGPLPADTPAHVCLVFDSSAGNRQGRFSVDGRFPGNFSSIGPSGPLRAPNGELYIGRCRNCAENRRGFFGKIDELKVWTAALSLAEIRAHCRQSGAACN